MAELLASVGGISDITTLQAAILHDTVEDTGTTGAELEEQFGAEVRRLVEEVSDDKSLPKPERKRLVIEHAPHLSPRAKLIKLADQIANIRSIAQEPPQEWSVERKRDYLDWSARVVAGVRGCNPALESLHDGLLAEGRRALAADAGGGA